MQIPGDVFNKQFQHCIMTVRERKRSRRTNTTDDWAKQPATTTQLQNTSTHT